jgi:hypothetical protein
VLITLSLAAPIASTAAASGVARPASATARAQASAASYAYYLVSGDGKVSAFGGAGYYGGAQARHLAAPVVAIAPTPDAKGYWLAEANGAVLSFGDAKFYGSLRHSHLPAGHQIISIKATADGKGYWLCDSRGIVTSFGDAPVLPSLKPRPHRAPIVGFAIAPHAQGAWLASSKGVIFRLGDSTNYGSLKHKVLKSPIVAMARSHSGLGYWLTNDNGRVWAFGDARPVARPPRLAAPVVGLSAAPATAGYWAASADGNVIGAGVPSRGGLTDQSGPHAVVGIAAAQVPPGTYAPGDVGYDVNWPQCASTSSSSVGSLPGPPRDPSGSMAYSVAVVGVDGWAVDDYNPCLAGEVKWAQQAKVDKGATTPPPYQLYLFLNSPASTSTIDQTGPSGTCSQLKKPADRPSCLAYNYGYNAALDAVSYAKSQGAAASMWWLDIENDACAPGEFNNANNGNWWSCNQALNDLTIQGALDGLRYDNVTAGIYSTAVQFKGIAGDFTPKGPPVPLWIAGAYWTSPPYPAGSGYIGTSNLAPWCKGKYNFAGGTPVLLQETPGSNYYPFDPDYAC